jgi:hypothetical protein
MSSSCCTPRRIMRKGKPHNPFSVQRTGPDGIEYIFSGGETAESVADEFERHGWTGELVGPCGVGKTTLLSTLAAEAVRRGMSVIRWTCNSDNRRLPRGWRRELAQAQVCFLDGAERCVPGDFRALCLACARLGVGLVVTLHTPGCFHLSRRVAVAPEIFERMVERLAAAGGCRVPPGLATDLLARRNGCAREALADLYRAFEDGVLMVSSAPSLFC